jgi:lipopolysaccharide transport system ATP-binding protein
MKPIITVKNLSKQYRIGAAATQYSTLRESLTNVIRTPLNWFRPNGTSGKGTIWALNDVSFQVRPGEVVGIIGRNGAGKSTLLKILSRITDPTRGEVDLYGRVGSLLEVGTGFHPELTGRENIYLNAAIMGMKRAEIKRKFNDIVAFAEIETFIDTPVKRFSSGMYMRLAFSVAAHIETEILLVDEVLAVGDASFQKRCLGKMSDVAREGRTVLFVSHNMGALSRLCKQGLLLSSGKLMKQGPIHEVIDAYTQDSLETNAINTFALDSNKVFQMLKLSLFDHKGVPATSLDRMHQFSIELEYVVKKRIVGAHVGFALDKADGTLVCSSADNDVEIGHPIDRDPGVYRARIDFPGGLLTPGGYQIRVALAKYGGQVYDRCEPLAFDLSDSGTFASIDGEGKVRAGILALPLKWETEKLSQAPTHSS